MTRINLTQVNKTNVFGLLFIAAGIVLRWRHLISDDALSLIVAGSGLSVGLRDAIRKVLVLLAALGDPQTKVDVKADKSEAVVKSG